EPVRRVRLHHRQLRRRRPVRRDRPEDPHHVTDVAVRLRARRRLVRPTWRQPLALTGLAIACLWIVVAVFAPLIAPHDPLAQTFTPAQPPSFSPLFGTDELGREVFSRVVYGARISPPIALLLVWLAAMIGGVLGGIAGYFRGITDGALMRVVDLFFAFP